ncbi:hypothetical protein EI77_01712 [Prosthecobacter fusiformis]|uniref:Uncharacterized protein n=1 Tax=Prosthecobacter fusiformis TaxID=48464 RepID=A0A4V3FG45_9BACT|nr:hypothetical protein EI77_01712 [Prosthecobacter fusiformis]
MTRRWKEVIRLLAEDAGVSKIADATMSAADKALERMSSDPRIAHAAWLLYPHTPLWPMWNAPKILLQKQSKKVSMLV